MHTVDIILALLALATLAELGYSAVVAVRGVRESREAPFVRDALRGPQPAAWPGVSVVVPAHNEERVAAACAKSILASNYPELELIFVLDRCTDGTRASLEPIAAADSRLRIVDNAACPSDWAGKCNAARVGADQVRHDVILFTDADTAFHPDLLRGSVAMLRAQGWQMVSLFSAPTHDHWFENVVQPVASISLLKIFPIRRANAGPMRRAFANGQFMLFERAAYEALGGHHAVKEDLLEDLGFARRMKRAGMQQGVGVSGGMLTVSMYDNWSAFRSGWRRIFIESCVRNPGRLRTQAAHLLLLNVVLPVARLALIALALGAMLADWPVTHMVALAALVLGLAAWAARLASLITVYALCQFPLWSVFFNSLASVAVAGIFVQGARDLVKRTPVKWGGKQYVLQPTNH